MKDTTHEQYLLGFADGKAYAASMRWEKATDEEKSNHMKMMARSRSKKLTPEERKAISRKAVNTRWEKYRANKQSPTIDPDPLANPQ